MANKVYMVFQPPYRRRPGDPDRAPATGVYDIYYVRATDERDARDKLREAVRRHVFKRTLADKANSYDPKTLGDDIIVENSITEEFLKLEELTVNDITDVARVFAMEGKDPWAKWDLNA